MLVMLLSHRAEETPPIAVLLASTPTAAAIRAFVRKRQCPSQPTTHVVAVPVTVAVGVPVQLGNGLLTVLRQLHILLLLL